MYNNKYYFKATVKEIHFAPKACWVTFFYNDKFCIKDKEYGIGYSLDGEVIKLGINMRFDADDSMLQFMSQHCHDLLEVCYEKNCDLDVNNDLNKSNVISAGKIIGATVSYE